MPQSNLLLASKIVVVEEPPSIRNIQGTPTSITAFLGVAERGPMRVPTFVTSFEEFVKVYGSYITTSYLAEAVEGFFRNGGSAAWISRTCHYADITDKTSLTAAKGAQDIVDRGGAATPAKLVSTTEPYALKPGDQLVVKVDAAGDATGTFTAAPATVTTQAGPFVLADQMTLIYQLKLPGSSVLGPQRTIKFLTGDFSNIAAATAAEVDYVLGRDLQGAKSDVNAGAVRIKTDKQGSGAQFVIVGGTALTALGLSAGTTNGTGNVADIDSVLAAEVAAVMTAAPLTTGTATASGGKATITGVVTGPSGQVKVQNTTTALGIFAGGLPITVNGSAAGQVPTMTVTAKDPGTFINSYTVAIQAASSGDANRFDFRLLKGTQVIEVWPNLSMTPSDARYFEDFINANSAYVVVTDLLSAATPPNNLPALGSYASWAGAGDGLVGLSDTDFVGSQAGQTGLYAFDQVDLINLLCVPGRATSAVHNAMLNYCAVDRVGQTFAILDPPANLSAAQVDAYFKTTASLLGITEQFAFYWPQVKVLNPSTSIFGVTTDNQIVVPPSGHIAGLYARIDAASPGGVYNAPAGVENGVLFGVLGFETDEVNDERKRDLIYPDRINPICKPAPNAPLCVDGSRTGKGDSNFPSIPERRGVNFIETSLKQGLLFAKHRNNDDRLRNEVKNSIDAFLLRQFANGAFRGTTPEESFFVDVSDKLNPPEVVFAGQLIVRIGLATQKPAEFIVLKFTQDTRLYDERLATLNQG